MEKFENLTKKFIDPNPYFYQIKQGLGSIKIRVRVTLSYIRNYPKGTSICGGFFESLKHTKQDLRIILFKNQV